MNWILIAEKIRYQAFRFMQLNYPRVSIRQLERLLPLLVKGTISTYGGRTGK